ncbi:MAG TPA: response regulator [Candidatus Paceibacterota bacterium]|nr:response regulator [Verrucomicrobiota bacterium]HSA12029.1 response regulator [Candidatus Paceibacterota bacterium]
MEPSTVKVLLVEDSPSDAALLQESLLQDGGGGFSFTHTESWADAVAQLKTKAYDVMLLDLTLPDSAGRETFVRARAQAPELPIVVLTGQADEEAGLEAVRHGIQDYLIKGQAYGRQTTRAIRYAIERKCAETALRQAEANLQRERDQLDVRVRQRTGELSEANRALQGEIARRERAEAAHREVLRRLAAAEETERGRISRELHDRLGQDLTALKLGLQVVRKGYSCPPSQLQSAAQLELLADSLMRDIHRLAWELRPAALDDFGLEMALRRYADEWAGLSGVPVDFHSRGTTGSRLAPELETALYRITREALTNVFRHADARRVSVLLERRGDHVSLIIEDDGKGFEAAALFNASPTEGKLGLLGMQERARLVGGSVEIESNPGAGTTVFVRLPLAPML